MNKRRLMFRGASLLMIAASGACASSHHSGPMILDVGELAERSGELDGQVVTVRGWIEIDPETFRLWETASAMERGKDEEQCVGISVPKGIDRKTFDRTQVIVHGQYVSDVSGRFVVLGGCRSGRFLILSSVESVTP